MLSAEKLQQLSHCVSVTNAFCSRARSTPLKTCKHDLQSPVACIIYFLFEHVRNAFSENLISQLITTDLLHSVHTPFVTVVNVHHRFLCDMLENNITINFLINNNREYDAKTRSLCLAMLFIVAHKHTACFQHIRRGDSFGSKCAFVPPQFSVISFCWEMNNRT